MERCFWRQHARTESLQSQCQFSGANVSVRGRPSGSHPAGVWPAGCGDWLAGCLPAGPPGHMAGHENTWRPLPALLLPPLSSAPHPGHTESLRNPTARVTIVSPSHITNNILKKQFLYKI